MLYAERYRLVGVVYITNMFRKLLNHPDFAGEHLKYVKYAFAGGDYVPIDLLGRFNSLMAEYAKKYGWNNGTVAFITENGEYYVTPFCFEVRDYLEELGYNVEPKYNEPRADIVENVIFNDEAKIADYAKDAVSALTSEEIIKGMDDGSFAPEKNATRAEAAKIIYSLIK